MFSILSNSGNIAYGWKDYIVDSLSDMPSLPTTGKPGSRAFVIETSQYFMLNHKKQWVSVILNNNDNDAETIIYEGGQI